MASEILMMAEVLSTEKAVDKAIIFEAIEAALANLGPSVLAVQVTPGPPGGDSIVHAAVRDNTPHYLMRDFDHLTSRDVPQTSSP